MKRIISAIMILCVFFTAFAVPTQAQEQDELFFIEPSLSDAPVALMSEIEIDANAFDGAMEKVRNAIRNLQDSVDISEYNIPASLYGEFDFSLAYCCAELFNFDDITLGYYLGEEIDSVVIEYKTSKSIYKAKLKAFDKETSRILSGVRKNFTDLEKIVYIHDYIVAHYAYDTRLYDNLGLENHDSYYFLFEGVGVCQSYAVTFRYFMEKLGIESRMAVSHDHAWNIVELDGEFYHIDCTWDDPLNYSQSDFKGQVHHEHLLLSDDGIKAADDPEKNQTSHAAWATYPIQYSDTVCDDSKYENYFWKDVTAPLVNYNNKWYGMGYNAADSNSYLFECNREFENIKNIHTIEEKWYATPQGGAFWTGCFSGLTLIGNTLYYNTSTSFGFYNLKNGKKDKKNINASEHGIYSSYYDDKGKLHFVTDLSPNDAVDETEIEYDIGMGDVNVDGSVTAVDLALVRQYLLGTDNMENFGLADVCYNNNVDVIDFIRLKKYVANDIETLF